MSAAGWAWCAGAYAFVVFVAVAFCKAARRGDDQLEAAAARRPLYVVDDQAVRVVMRDERARR